MNLGVQIMQITNTHLCFRQNTKHHVQEANNFSLSKLQISIILWRTFWPFCSPKLYTFWQLPFQWLFWCISSTQPEDTGMFQSFSYFFLLFQQLVAKAAFQYDILICNYNLDIKDVFSLMYVVHVASINEPRNFYISWISKLDCSVLELFASCLDR